MVSLLSTSLSASFVSTAVVLNLHSVLCYIGIWMCRGKNMNVLVLDVEGTDGRERGEDQVRSGDSRFCVPGD